MQREIRESGARTREERRLDAARPWPRLDIRIFHPGQTILRESEYGEMTYILVHGEASCSRVESRPIRSFKRREATARASE